MSLKFDDRQQPVSALGSIVENAIEEDVEFPKVDKLSTFKSSPGL